MSHRLFGIVLVLSVLASGVLAEEVKLPLKAGIIGIDAHARPWTQIINNPKAEGEIADMKIVAAFPGGSEDIPQSISLREAAMEPLRKAGVEIVDSIDELIEKVDVVLILSIDGRPHLEQAEEGVCFRQTRLYRQTDCRVSWSTQSRYSGCQRSTWCALLHQFIAPLRVADVDGSGRSEAG